MASKHKDLPRSPIARETSKSVKTGSWRTFRPEVDKGSCSKCLTCWKFCPEVAIDIVDEYPVVNYDFCKGCGICANECPKKCVKMVREELD